MSEHNTGAGAALKRAEDEEAEASKILQDWKNKLAEFQKEREAGKWGDDQDERNERSRLEMEINAAYDRWGKCAKLFLEFEKNVAPEKRDSGAKVTQAQAVKYMEAILLALEIAEDAALLSVAQDVIPMKSEQEVHRHCAPIFQRNRETIFKALIREEKVPAWLLPQIEAE